MGEPGTKEILNLEDLEASGNREKVEAFVEMLRPLGINDLTRSGYIAINRLSEGEEVVNGQ